MHAGFGSSSNREPHKRRSNCWSRFACHRDPICASSSPPSPRMPRHHGPSWFLLCMPSRRTVSYRVRVAKITCSGDTSANTSRSFPACAETCADFMQMMFNKGMNRLRPFALSPCQAESTPTLCYCSAESRHLLLRTLRSLLPACTTIAGCITSGIIGAKPLHWRRLCLF